MEGSSGGISKSMQKRVEALVADKHNEELNMMISLCANIAYEGILKNIFIPGHATCGDRVLDAALIIKREILAMVRK